MEAPVKTQATFADYAATPETNQIVELIDGEIVVNPPVDKHQETLGEVYGFLRSIVKAGKLRFAPSGLHFDDGNSFEPDLFWVSPENEQCFLEPNKRYWHGAPDLVVEILSPTTAYRDRGHKFQTYEKYGVREYWLVDPEAKLIEVYQHNGKQFDRRGVFEGGQSFASAVLSATIVGLSLLTPVMLGLFSISPPLPCNGEGCERLKRAGGEDERKSWIETSGWFGE